VWREWRVVLVWGTGLTWGSVLSGEAVVELAPYEVEAWHFDGLAMETPAGVLRLERAEIEGSGVGSVPEVLEKLAGIRFRGFTGNGTEGQMAMRGFGDNSGLRVLVVVDGQVYNVPDMGGINWTGLDVAELETVEVLRGGQTVLYGNHAVSGVVKLQTRRPGAGLEARVEGGWGSDGLARYSIGMGRGFGSLGLRAGAQWMEANGYRDNSASSAWSGHLSWRTGGDPEAGWSGMFRAGHSELQFPGPLTYEQMLEDPTQSNSNGEDLSETDEWQATFAGRVDWRGRGWQLVGGALQRDREWSLDGIRADNRQRRGTLSPRLKFGSGPAFAIIGADLARDELDYTDFVSDTEDRIVRARADVRRTTSGAYAFASKALSEALEVSGGLRLEAARTDNTYLRYREEQLRPVLVTNRGTFPNPNFKDPPDVDTDLSFAGPIDKSGWAAEISLVGKLRPGLNLCTGWDRVYRYPALDEAAAYQGYPLGNPLNTSLEPETGHNFEAGVKGFGDNWHLGLTGFVLLLDDEIAYDDGERLNRNIGSTIRAGLELDCTYQADRYGINLHASLIRARFRDEETGARVPLVPAFEGGVRGWIQPAGRVRLQAHFRYLSSQYQGNDFMNEFRRIPGYGLLDLAVSWEPWERVFLLLAVNNVTDRTHAVSAYSGGFYPGSGRTVQGRLRYSF